ncbi:MAG TPA: hypothetical protein P5076_22630, partial [Myxococcota bacterium]|nr:hypothetical protein [Myxococcota bacterium]
VDFHPLDCIVRLIDAVDEAERRDDVPWDAARAKAHARANELIERDPELRAPEHQALRDALWRRWGQRLMLAEVA